MSDKKSYLNKLNKIIVDEFSSTKKILSPLKLTEMLKATQNSKTTVAQLKELYNNYNYQHSLKSKVEPIKKSRKGIGRSNKQTRLHIEQLNKINIYPNVRTQKYRNIKLSTKMPETKEEIEAEKRKMREFLKDVYKPKLLLDSLEGIVPQKLQDVRIIEINEGEYSSEKLDKCLEYLKKQLKKFILTMHDRRPYKTIIKCLCHFEIYKGEARPIVFQAYINIYNVKKVLNTNDEKYLLDNFSGRFYDSIARKNTGRLSE